jgi:hypothetical protein
MLNLKFIDIDEELIDFLKKYCPYDNKEDKTITFIEESSFSKFKENEGLVISINYSSLKNLNTYHNNYLFEFSSPKGKVLKNPQYHTLPVLYALFPIISFISAPKLVMRYPVGILPKGNDYKKKVFFNGSYYLDNANTYMKELEQILERKLKSSIVFIDEKRNQMKVSINAKKVKDIKIYESLKKLYRNKKNINVVNNFNDRIESNEVLNIVVNEDIDSIDLRINLNPMGFNITNLYSLIDNLK